MSALTVWRYSATASTSQPMSVETRAMMPAASTHSPNTSPSITANSPNAPRNGRHDGPGMWTPGGGPSWTVAGTIVVVGPMSWS